MSDDAPKTPVPEPCKAMPCPYHAEVELVRAWRSAGLDELMILSRRRDRWTLALVGALLVVLLGTGATAIWGGVEFAAELGQLRGTVTTRLEVVEATVAADRAQISRMDQAAADGQTTVLVTLGEMREQLRSIDARMQSCSRRCDPCR